jgi:hypothetical protein
MNARVSKGGRYPNFAFIIVQEFPKCKKKPGRVGENQIQQKHLGIKLNL